ncbi:tyrosine-type recombinase/integrase [Paraburkholderia terricola]|uniref:tyrosine-type recombinase/integrase n=1 Tax=Paraburkholderia terricola TaxID=169427 RepID=UPI000DEFCFEF|nr:site-specific integrase [Paraburkholderia terricola]AXE96124.1 integrase [Paraburkholderia terricola]
MQKILYLQRFAIIYPIQFSSIRFRPVQYQLGVEPGVEHWTGEYCMRAIHRLTVATVRKLISSPPERTKYVPDGGGLQLQITPAGTTSWVYCYQLHNRSHSMGLGRFPDVSLADARAKAAEAARLKAAGIDPLGQKRHARRTAALEAAKRLAFAEAAEQFIKLREPAWSASNAEAWRSTLTRYATPIIGRLDVSEIDTGHLLKVIEPVWTKHNATAVQLRARIENILDWATSKGSRSGENPARFTGHLENLLPKVQEKTQNRPALDYREIHGFMKALRAEAGNVARAMEYVVLTGARSSEATGATWREIDLDGRVWHVPAERMKKRIAHDVPLSDQALALLEALPGEHRPDDRLFPSVRGGQICDPLLSGLLRKLGYPLGAVTTHGFRSTLRTWLSERTPAPSAVAEACIAHDKRDKVQQAYERTRFFEQRVPLMTLWADFIDSPFVQDATVLPIRAA